MLARVSQVSLLTRMTPIAQEGVRIVATAPPEADATTQGTMGSSQTAVIVSSASSWMWNMSSGMAKLEATVSATSIHHRVNTRVATQDPNRGPAISTVPLMMVHSAIGIVPRNILICKNFPFSNHTERQNKYGY